MANLQKYNELDKLFYGYFKKGVAYDMIAQHYAETMGASLVNEQIAESACDLFKFFNSNPSAQQLDAYYNAFYNGAKKLFDARNAYAKRELLDKILEFQALLGLLNLVMENGTYFDILMANLKTNNEDWLEVVSNADKANLSIDGAKNRNSEAFSIESDDVQKYLVFKKWKDKLHYLYMDTISICSSDVASFLQKDSNNYDVFFELIKYLLIEKYSKQITSIDEITYLVRGYYFEFVRGIFGGKAFGLALLNEHGFKIPETYVASINCSNIDYSIFTNNKKYAVRSSADVEDGENHSFAGMFDSFLDVSAENLSEYVQKVKNSVNTPRLKSYVEHLNLCAPNMAVIIQEYRPCEYAGVWMGKDLRAGGIEWVQGNGEKLVSGNVTPNVETYSLDEYDKTHLSVNGKIVAGCMLEAQNSIYAQTKKLADIEWCVCGGELIFLQYRSVTAQIQIQEKAKTDASVLGATISGVACSKGVVSGRVKFVENPESVVEWNNDDILLVVYTSPEWITLMLKAKAIITCYGGFFSHAGIIAREFNIPCVSGVGNKIQELNNKLVRVDGNTGQIVIKE